MNVKTRPDEARRRAFWSEQMDAAFVLTEEFRRYPVRECGETFVSLRDTARSAGVEMLLSSTEFMGKCPRLFFLREGLIDSILAVARDMKARGWLLKIEDGYRTYEMQKTGGRAPCVFDALLQCVLRETGGRIPSPKLMLRRLTAVVATMPKLATHMSGSALDISVVQADDGQDVDRGGPYLEISELTPMASPFVSDRAQQNRVDITALMERHGFMAYPYEFWHYSQGDVFAESLLKTGKPGRYGAVNWDSKTGKTTPLTDQEGLLNSLEDIQAEIKNALARQSCSHTCSG